MSDNPCVRHVVVLSKSDKEEMAIRIFEFMVTKPRVFMTNEELLVGAQYFSTPDAEYEIPSDVRAMIRELAPSGWFIPITCPATGHMWVYTDDPKHVLPAFWFSIKQTIGQLNVVTRLYQFIMARTPNMNSSFEDESILIKAIGMAHKHAHENIVAFRDQVDAMIKQDRDARADAKALAALEAQMA